MKCYHQIGNGNGVISQVKAKSSLSPLKLFLVVLILKHIFSRSTFGALHTPHWQKLTKVNVLHTLPWSIGARCSHNYPQHLCISDTNCFCHTKCVQSSPTCVTSVSHDQIFMSPDHPTMCKRQFCNMKKEFSKENVVQHLKLRWFPPNDLKPSKSKWRRSRQGPPSKWEAPIPTFTGNDPCVNTFGPRGNWLFLLAMFTCQRLVGACA